MFSTLGWFSFIRKYLRSIMLFFNAAIYCLFDSWKKVKTFIYFWIIFSVPFSLPMPANNNGLAWQILNGDGPMRIAKYLTFFCNGDCCGSFRSYLIPLPPAFIFASIAAQCIILIYKRKKLLKIRFWLSVAYGV